MLRWYTRPKGSIGDSLTDIGAMALWDKSYAKQHIESCQREDGRVFRHPFIKEEHIDHAPGISGCADHACTFSRDHTISLINYTNYSGDKEPLRKFFWFCLGHGFQHSQGAVGQRFQNFNTVLAMCAVLYPVLAYILWPLCFPALLLAAKRQQVGYRLVMVAEVCLALCLSTPLPGIGLISKAVLRRQPYSVFYQVVAGLCMGDVNKYLSIRQLNYHKQRQITNGCDDSWLWSDPEDGRIGTGIDITYIENLIRRYQP